VFLDPVVRHSIISMTGKSPNLIDPVNHHPPATIGLPGHL